MNTLVRKVVVERLQAWFVTGSKAQQIIATFALCLAVGLASGALFAFLKWIYVVALLAALAGGVLMLRDTRFTFFALVGVICLLPFAVVPGPNLGFTPTLLDVIMVILLFTWLFRLARRKQSFISTELGTPILVFMLLVCASFVIGLSYGSLTQNLLRHFVELLLNIWLFFMIVNNVRTSRTAEQIVTVLILAALAAALLGIVLYVIPSDLTVRLLSALRIFRYPTGSDVLRYVEDNTDLPLRATSTSIDPNVLGGVLAAITALAVPQFLTRDPLPIFGRAGRWRGLNWAVVPVLGTLLLCVLLTYSRAALAGLGLTVLILAMLRYRKLLIFALLAGLLILLLPQTQAYVQRFIEGAKGEDLATQMRLGEYKDAITLISRHPWFGVGFAQAPDIDVYIGVSSLYFLMAEEIGLVGLSMFLCIIGLVFRRMARGFVALREHPRQEALLWGLCGALLCVLFSGTLDHYFFNINFQHAVALFWLCLGLAVTITLLPESEDHLSKEMGL